MERQGQLADRAEIHREIARENGERIIANPGIALDAITHGQATFTNRDIAMFAHRHSDGREQFDAVLGAVRSSPDLIALGKDGRGEDRFTSREMIETEQRRSEEHTSELQSLMRTSYAVFCLKKKKKQINKHNKHKSTCQ